MRALRNTERVLNNAGVERRLEIEREKGIDLQIADIREEVVAGFVAFGVVAAATQQMIGAVDAVCDVAQRIIGGTSRCTCKAEAPRQFGRGGDAYARLMRIIGSKFF